MKNRFGLLYLVFLVFVLLSTVLRTVLLVKSLPFLDPGVGLFVKIFGVGLFFDVVTFFYLALPFALYLAVVPDRFFKHPLHRPLVSGMFFFIVFALAFDCAAEYLFFDEFGTRFNFIAVDYLVYTREVVGNIKESYSLAPIFGGLFVLSGSLFFACRKALGRVFLGTSTVKARLRIGALFALAPLLALAFVDLSLTDISKNSYADELAGNGIYDLVAAFKNNELDYDRFYATRDERAMLASLRDLLREKNNHFASDEARDVIRVIAGRGSEQRRNVVVVVEESLSAEYLGAFGNPDGRTPNLDRLSRESLFFTRLYATGTRTVRGLEALTLSIPPLPGISIVKRPGNEGLFSWGSVMREKGYDTKYVYAGYGYFDNMNYFFSHNGFDVVDRSSFDPGEVTFANIWGVCDEDLFRKAVREADASHAAGKPFFTMVMTTSNHRPYTYPDGKIDIPSGSGRGGGVKYADYALGRFIAEARTKPWFNDTIFVIVADHCAASSGKVELPLWRYKIPLLIYAPAHIKPQRIDTLASQIDVAPTVLGLLNFNYATKFMGRDILAMEASRGRAFISTYQKLGYAQDDALVVLGPKRYVGTYTVDRETGNVAESRPRDEYVNRAISYFQGAAYLYANRLNRAEPLRRR